MLSAEMNDAQQRRKRMPLRTGLMAFWANFEEADIQALRQWHNCQHMSERVNIPGFRLGRRYAGLGDAATFLMYYETTSADVLAGSDYQAALNNPTDWTKDALTLFRDPARAIFSLAEEAGVNPCEPSFFLSTLRFNVAENGGEMRAAYRDDILESLVADSNVIRARLWENQEEITAIKTQESSIYGKGPGKQQFCLFVESIEKPDRLKLAELESLSPGLNAKHSDEISETGWLDFALG
ncbi:MAG: hypothetical protein GY798_02305 [Hyphomicrobiales bacterium]|nr:hypothetical protein [Hyphomicrobiales bacterium]